MLLNDPGSCDDMQKRTPQTTQAVGTARSVFETSAPRSKRTLPKRKQSEDVTESRLEQGCANLEPCIFIANNARAKNLECELSGIGQVNQSPFTIESTYKPAQTLLQ